MFEAENIIQANIYLLHVHERNNLHTVYKLCTVWMWSPPVNLITSVARAKFPLFSKISG